MGEYFFGITDTGRQRDNNEDAFIAELTKDGTIIGAAIDGVGGYSGGEIAADIAKNTLLTCLHSSNKPFLKILTEGIEAANKKIYEERSKLKEHDKMACVLTVVAAKLEENKFYYAHVGDTRLYLFRDESLVKVTKDHSVVGFLEESGRLTEEEAMRHPRRNEINKALGFELHENDKDDFVECGSSPFLPGDQLLICTDGLTDMIKAKEIIAVLSNKELSIEEKGNALVTAANNAGGRDNITAVIIWNNKKPASYEAIKPAIAIKEEVQTAKKELKKEVPTHLAIADDPIKRNRSGFIIVSGILLAGLLLYMLNRRHVEKPIDTQVVLPVASYDFMRLKDSIQHGTSKIITLNNESNIVFKDSIVIYRDSLEIIGNGTHFVCDSIYKGAAFVLGLNAKSIVFDSIFIKNFTTGIVVNEKGLKLRSVVFDHCELPVKYQYLNNEDSIKAHNRISKYIKKDDSLKAKKK